MHLSIFSQAPTGRYFEDIQGVTWVSSDITNESNIQHAKGFGLSILGGDITDIKSNCSLWSFNEKLKVESYDATTGETELIISCKYEHNRTDKTLTLFLKDGKVTYSYVSVSTGNYIGFTKKRR